MNTCEMIFTATDGEKTEQRVCGLPAPWFYVNTPTCDRCHDAMLLADRTYEKDFKRAGPVASYPANARGGCTTAKCEAYPPTPGSHHATWCERRTEGEAAKRETSVSEPYDDGLCPEHNQAAENERLKKKR